MPRLHGVANILRFNWPQYAAAAFVIVASAILFARLDGTEAMLAAAAFVIALYFVAASLLASWTVYDHSPIYDWTWLRAHAGDAHTIINVHAGFDETTDGVGRALQRNVHPFAFYDPASNTEASIARAQNGTAATRFRTGQLPLRTASCDAILLLFAAHEIRQPAERERCFADVAATLSAGGRAIVVEHLRDARNFAVFGPGALHFYSRREWLRIARSARLDVAHEFDMTPFVHVFVLTASGARP
ncbi:MAG TPA: methyltransferase [Thermoanaerobaculia bacterium]|nr:methyltransferase [Thermoanaerobaculia bacterium]